MRIQEIVEGTRCWKGYEKKGMKTMFGKRVPNCVKKESAEDSGSDLDRLYNIIDELTPDDVGEQRSGEYVLKFEGFSAWCQNDAAERCELPDGDPRKLNAYEDVYDEVQGGWDKEMGSEPIDAGFSGDEDYPVQWAIYKTNINENLRDWFGKGKKGGAGGGGWDAYNSKGERIGKCGDTKGSAKPKCLSKSKAASLRNADKNNDGKKDGKAGIARAVKRKRKKDPNKNRKGKAKNVKN